MADSRILARAAAQALNNSAGHRNDAIRSLIGVIRGNEELLAHIAMIAVDSVMDSRRGVQLAPSKQRGGEQT